MTQEEHIEKLYDRIDKLMDRIDYLEKQLEVTKKSNTDTPNYWNPYTPVWDKITITSDTCKINPNDITVKL